MPHIPPSLLVVRRALRKQASCLEQLLAPPKVLLETGLVNLRPTLPRYDMQLRAQVINAVHWCSPATTAERSLGVLKPPMSASFHRHGRVSDGLALALTKDPVRLSAVVFIDESTGKFRYASMLDSDLR